MSEPQPDERLRPAMNALAACDDDIARAYEACGLPPVRRQPADFAGMVNIIAAQQLSVHAARAICERLRAAIGPLTPESFLAVPEEEARNLGLSRPKVRYLRGIAEAEQSGDLDFAELAEVPDDEAMARLTAIKGVGRWTAEIFLLFALERPDVFPAQDLALQVSGQRLKRLEDRPSADVLRELADSWRPYRSAAARFLWHYYRHPGVA
jgi:DNA-3-methyladenine glycosylase II